MGKTTNLNLTSPSIVRIFFAVLSNPSHHAIRAEMSYYLIHLEATLSGF